MKRLLLPLIVACLAAMPTLQADSKTTSADTPIDINDAFTVQRYVYNEEGEIVQRSISVNDYVQTAYDYKEATSASNKSDDVRAIKLYSRAAKAGHDSAQYNLGVFYNNGIGVTRDYELALHWYRVSARNGNPSAYNNLGWLTQHGQGCEPNLKQAMEYYKAASEMRNDTASINLARAYFKGGKDVPQNIDQAFHYLGITLTQATPYNSYAALDFCEWVLFDTDTTDSVAIEKALRTLEIMEKHDNRSAAYQLGRYYAQEDDETSRESAFKHYQKAAELGSTNGMANTAYRLYKGRGVKKDPQAAYELYTKLLEKAPNNRYAVYMMGLMYLRGDPIPKDDVKAYEYFKNALELHNRRACEYLAWMTWKGVGCQQNLPLAAAYYELAGNTATTRMKDNAKLVRAELLPEQRQQAEQIAKDFRALHWGEEQD
ncbi:MAG: hypothetical protein ACQKBW_00575 [Puniceicoccales bacterium]